MSKNSVENRLEAQERMRLVRKFMHSCKRPLTTAEIISGTKLDSMDVSNIIVRMRTKGEVVTSDFKFKQKGKGNNRKLHCLTRYAPKHFGDKVEEIEEEILDNSQQEFKLPKMAAAVLCFTDRTKS